MSELFSLPKKIPSYKKQIALYRTTKLKTLSPRESTVARYFAKRINQYKEVFQLKQEPEDHGDILSFKDKEIDFEVYKASDSFWWVNRNLAFQETLMRGAKLPDNDTAAKNADAYLKMLGVNMTHAKFESVTQTEVIRDNNKRKEIERQKTAVNVNYSFNIDGTPVVGPGAKIQVSYCDQNVVSQVFYFWRNTDKSEEMNCIHPDTALEKFMKDPRYIRLDERTSSGQIHEMKLNYYALPPFEFQRYLIPVYTIKGTVSTKYLERYDFSTNIIAVNITPEQIKKAGIVADPNSCQIFD